MTATKADIEHAIQCENEGCFTCDGLSQRDFCIALRDYRAMLLEDQARSKAQFETFTAGLERAEAKILEWGRIAEAHQKAKWQARDRVELLEKVIRDAHSALDGPVSSADIGRAKYGLRAALGDLS